MYYTIYRVTNKINGKYYVGKHQTTNLDDGYMGSGKLIRRAIKKYGLENFLKEILFIFDNEKDMNEKEKDLVVVSEESYNLCDGGKGGFGYINKTMSSDMYAKNGAKGGKVDWSDERRNNQSIRLKEEYKNGTRVSHFKDRDLWTGRKHSKKTIQKMSESAKGRIPWNKGRFHSEETKAKISAAMINREKS